MLITFPKYVLRELGKAFGISLLVFTFVFLAMYCALMVNEGATMLTAFSLLPHFFPLISPLALPLAVITGILICYGRLSANNEFVGSQASGINPIWVALPALTVAGLSSLITVYLNDEVLTSSVASIERSLLANKTEIIRGRLTKPGSFVFPMSDEQSFAICRLPSSWDAQDRTGVDFTIFKRAAAGVTPPQGWDPNYPYPESRVLARHHKIDVTEDEEGTMHLNCRFEDASESTFSGDVMSLIESPATKKSFALPKSGVNFTISRDRNQYKGIDRLRLDRRNLETKMSEQDLQIHKLAASLIGALTRLITAGPAATATSVSLEKEAAAVVNGNNLERMQDLIRRLKEDAGRQKLTLPDDVNRDLAIMNTSMDAANAVSIKIRDLIAEVHTKMVMSFACISFAMIGIPIGLLSKRGGSMIGFVVGIGFAFAFYMIITALHGAVRDASIPWWGLWVPDMLVLVVGVILWFRSVRSMC